jgi:hypothetical protein
MQRDNPQYSSSLLMSMKGESTMSLWWWMNILKINLLFNKYLIINISLSNYST